EVTGLTGLYVVSLARLFGLQVVVEPVVSVAADDQGVLVLVAGDVVGGFAELFLGRGGLIVHREVQIRKAHRAQPYGHSSLEDRRRPSRERAGYGAGEEEVDGG
ncbi:MAG TPA: hypothetical protein VFG82_00115, partial [Rubrobacter sp.]|nr:hypothetical protein [Rubrobacter sp.]